MTLRHLTIFQAVCTYGTMTKAAEVLGMAQPPISQAVAELEGHYNALLFERRGRRLVITPAGARLQSYAAHILALVTEARSSLRELEKLGHLKVGASKTVGASLLPPTVDRFRKEYPGSRINLVVDSTAVILHQLRAAELDLALVEGPVGDGQWVVEQLCQDELVLIASPVHPWANGTIRVQDLEGMPFLVREPGSGTRETFEAAMATRGVPWTNAGEIGDAAAIVALVASDFGLAFLSERTVRGPVGRGDVCRVTVEGLEMTRSFRLVTHQNKAVSPALVRFSQLAREVADRL